MVGIKRILFGMTLILLGIWAFGVAQEGEVTLYGVVGLLAPTIGVIFAVWGLLKKE